MAQLEEINNRDSFKDADIQNSPSPKRPFEWVGFFDMQQQFLRLWENFAYWPMFAEKDRNKEQPSSNNFGTGFVVPSPEGLLVNPIKAAAAYWSVYHEYSKAMTEFFESNIELLKENAKPFAEWYASASTILMPPDSFHDGI